MTLINAIEWFIEFRVFKTTRKFFELIKVKEPLVQDPFGSLDDGTASVQEPPVPESLLIEIEPKSGRPSSWPNKNFVAWVCKRCGSSHFHIF